ncbi:hypothetical protein Cme02nite_45250 [Catellatospora methionotrophica]|uniref:DUF2637 domain-containing protein n=1 Tax=Catellatospora methionotrophica TaxID=121620 RepID=A0A8J3L872_9ACTN|nr:DUF2637 domain-containing protein [Catellatospora methionotrophica]GIG16193.1 hypothetical protein Cme02nite_45250 [Catellatospora methionotrophica]
MKLAQFTKYAAIGAVAGIAAYASYTHMRELAVDHGQPGLVAALLPVSVDGMLIVATIAMREDRQANLRVRPWAWIAFVLGVAASVVANVLAAADDITSRVISAWPAIALLLVIEVLATGRKSAELPAEATVVTRRRLTTPPNVAPSTTVDELPAEVAPTKPAAKKAAPVKKATPRRPVEETRKLATELLASAPDVKRKDVAQALDLTERRVRQVLNEDTGEQRKVNGTEVLEQVAA